MTIRVQKFPSTEILPVEAFFACGKVLLNLRLIFTANEGILFEERG